METTVGSLIRATDSIIRNILGIRTSVSYTDGGYGIEAEDLRKETFSTIPDIEYYQVRANKLGFRANLSILDLIFNMGTEAPLILKKSNRKYSESKHTQSGEFFRNITYSH